MPHILPAELSDVTALAGLLQELDRFYGVTEFEPLTQREAELTAVLATDPPLIRVLLAKDGDDVVGMAAYSFLWPATGLTYSLFLKELYVRRTQQRRSIGRALMQRVCEVAVARGCSRVEWQTETDNANARAFYASLGAPVLNGKVGYRLGQREMRQVAEAGRDR